MKSPSLTPEILRAAKLRLLQMHHASRVGHLGGNLSVLDILMCLHHAVMEPADQFVLSKGHAAGALYITLWSMGLLCDEDLRQFHQDATRLPGHPPSKGIPEILFATGSLGHGLSLACGLAFALQLAGRSGRVFCVMSDGEWEEGSCWEALIFAAHRKLANLTIVVDHNGLQGFGSVRAVAGIEPLAEKFRAFGLTTMEVDGHNIQAMTEVLRQRASTPLAIVARTIKGHGISFMEGQMAWHYLPLTDALYQQAVDEVGR